MKKIIVSYFLLFVCYSSFAQKKLIVKDINIEEERADLGPFEVYPMHWWIGMKNPKLQLMIHRQNAGLVNYSITSSSVQLIKINKVENKNYVFLDLLIKPNAKPESFKINFIENGTHGWFPFELKPRRSGNGTSYAQGVTSKDFIYLIMPDRFSNGDTTNDRVAGMKDQSLNRNNVGDRHGGDLQGVQNHLDYIKNLGVTTIWLNPVLENDMPHRTEHGYAFTNHYRIDPRLGGEKAYHNLIDAAHAKGLKIIQDAVYNHVGLYHFTVQDPPMKDWLHQWPKFTRTTYKDQILFDPYAVPSEKKQMSDGWFEPMMPDMNQSNPYVANYLIQHAIWTVEEFGIDGWRIDTYAYNDLDFMNRCNKALMDEYPKLTMFGETWVHGVPNQSYFVQNNYNLPFKSNLQASTDFQTLWAITETMTKDFGWDDGVSKLYTTLAQDFVYKDPTREVIFLDNHDMSRFFSVVNEDVNKYLSSVTWLLTSRGIPQIYYGDEFVTTGTTSPSDGYVRLDFPGGWAGDKINKFTAEGRTEKDQTIYKYLTTLANYRKTSSALTTGKLMQYVPQDGLYVYFRYDEKQTVMVVMNTSKKDKKIDLEKYNGRTNGFSKMKNIFTGETSLLKDVSVEANSALVYELIK